MPRVSPGPFFGWYSATAAFHFGTATYTDEYGHEVKVTEVTSTEQRPPTGWDDLKAIGKLVAFVRNEDKLPPLPAIDAPSSEYVEHMNALERVINRLTSERN